MLNKMTPPAQTRNGKFSGSPKNFRNLIRKTPKKTLKKFLGQPTFFATFLTRAWMCTSDTDILASELDTDLPDHFKRSSILALVGVGEGFKVVSQLVFDLRANNCLRSAAMRIKYENLNFHPL